ncbi:hypothetical protein F5Y00DRAFT_245672 [Daldinia vernicosa]|uniref:uncharacterized protein n=1 Tax=Daldinia vernicosa TaxID=114800 RepID=UPI002007AB72|nr:uncharacterized protein F5Y00DRAFT_245672 [Daldinia vernicosa]KAI0845794.1 hypothetical protein F5Y00DRAFT_245672 [Daldinia vernicosa]
MSSFTRAALPVGLAVAFGVWNAYYVLDPAFKEQQEKTLQRLAKDNQQLDKVTEVKDSTQQKTPKTDTLYNR